jgi:hypothetical protein
MLPNALTDAREGHPELMRPEMSKDGTPGETGSFEMWFGATLVWLLFLGLALNIWPGWTRIAAWLR